MEKKTLRKEVLDIRLVIYALMWAEVRKIRKLCGRRVTTTTNSLRYHQTSMLYNERKINYGLVYETRGTSRQKQTYSCLHD